MSKHTPGPWHPTAGTEIISDTDLSIAMLNVRRDEWTDNARLIAAAPDLLAACQLALFAFETRSAIDWDVLSAAIAKACGE